MKTHQYGKIVKKSLITLQNAQHITVVDRIASKNNFLDSEFLPESAITSDYIAMACGYTISSCLIRVFYIIDLRNTIVLSLCFVHYLV